MPRTTAAEFKDKYAKMAKARYDMTVKALEDAIENAFSTAYLKHTPFPFEIPLNPNANDANLDVMRAYYAAGFEVHCMGGDKMVFNGPRA